MERNGRKIVYVLTKNRVKMLAAQSAFSRFGIEAKFKGNPYPEIQAQTSAEIAKHTTNLAVKRFNAPVIREDHSLYIDGLAIPGPYVSYIEKKIPAKNLVKILKALSSNMKGHYELSASYAAPNGDKFEHSYKVPIVFATRPRGTLSKGWDCVTMFPGSKKTFGEDDPNNYPNVWNKNFIAIAKHISKKGH